MCVCLNLYFHDHIRPKKKNVYVALSRPTVKCEKTGPGFFFFFFFFPTITMHFSPSARQFIHIRPKKKKCYVALSRPTVKCEKTGSGFFKYFLCQIWAKNLLKFVFNGLKKHLHDLYMRFDCIPPEFSPFRNFKKNIGKLNSLTVHEKKKKKKKPDRPTQFSNFGRVRATNNFFFGPRCIVKVCMCIAIILMSGSYT